MTRPIHFSLGLFVGIAVLGGIAAQANTRGGVAEPEFDAGQSGSSAAISLAPTRPASHGGIPVPERAAEERRGNPLWAVPIGSLAVTRERPIFSSSRRPPAPMIAPPPPPAPIVQAPPPVADVPGLTLVGSVVSGEQAIAVFFDSANRLVRLKVGEAHSGWVLRRVQARETALEKDRRTVVLKLPLPSEVRTSIPLEPARLGPSAGVLPGLAHVDPAARVAAPPPVMQLAPDYMPGAVPSATGRLPGL